MYMHSGNSNRKDTQNTGRTFLLRKMYFTGNPTTHLYSIFHPEPLCFLNPPWNHVSHDWTAPTLVCTWPADILCPVRFGSFLGLYKILYFPVSTMPFSHHCSDNTSQTCLAQTPLHKDLQQPPSILHHGRCLWLEEKNGEGQINLQSM